MKKDGFDRRDFLKSAVAGGAAAAAVSVPQSVSAQPTSAPSATASPGYAFLNPEEAAFVEAVVDHMFAEVARWAKVIRDANIRAE